MGVSNLIEPLEKIYLSNQTVKCVYYMPINGPRITIDSLMLTTMSYMDQSRVAVGNEKDFRDHMKFRRCIEKTFSMIFDAADTS
ncbi:hypothetical protein LXL04_037644 [Taraxacum kok-saghyz]